MNLLITHQKAQSVQRAQRALKITISRLQYLSRTKLQTSFYVIEMIRVEMIRRPNSLQCIVYYCIIYSP